MYHKVIEKLLSENDEVISNIEGIITEILKKLLKYNILRLIIIVMVILALPPEIVFDDQVINQFYSVEPVVASRNLPSNNPNAFQSGSGRIHLLFLHQNRRAEIVVSYHYYHTFQLEEGGWSVPKKFEQRDMTIYYIKPNKSGFTIYFSIGGLGLYKRSYNEDTDTWLTPVELFGESYILEYLNIPRDEYRWWIDKYFFIDNDAFILLWSFEVETAIHVNENCYIVSRIETNGSIMTHPLEWLYVPFYYGDFQVVSSNGSIFLYRNFLSERSVLSTNGTWSNWRASGLDVFLTTYNIPFGDHWTVIESRYFIGLTRSRDAKLGTNPIWIKVDLTAENLTANTFNVPCSSDFNTPYKMDFELNSSTSSELIFGTALITNRTIELWNVNFLDDEWGKISSFDHIVGISWQRYLVFTIDLVHNGSNWLVFWDQHTAPGCREIFSVTYNTETGKWTPVTMVTDTNKISDDYTNGVVGFIFPITLMSLILAIPPLRKRKKILVN